MKQRGNQLIEAFRFFACALVVFIHVPFPLPYGGYICAFARFAVPFFLMVSGYFTYGTDPAAKAKAVKKLRDTVITVAAAGAVCFAWNCVNSFLRRGSAFQWISRYLNRRTLFEWLVFNRAVFLNSVFYYFFMLIYLYILFIAACRFRLDPGRARIPIAVLLTAAAWFVDLYATPAWYYAGNVLLTGIPMFLLGQALRADPRLAGRIYRREPLLMLLGILLTCAEYMAKPRGDVFYVYIGQILFAAALLCYALNRPERKAPRFAVFLGTSCTLYMMVIHCEIRDTLALFMSMNTWRFPLLVFACSDAAACAAAFICRLIRRKRTH